METLVKKRDHLSMKVSDQTEESSEKNGVSSFYTNPVDECEKGLSFHTENSAPPTV